MKRLISVCVITIRNGVVDPVSHTTRETFNIKTMTGKKSSSNIRSIVLGDVLIFVQFFLREKVEFEVSKETRETKASMV